MTTAFRSKTEIICRCSHGATKTGVKDGRSLGHSLSSSRSITSFHFSWVLIKGAARRTWRIGWWVNDEKDFKMDAEEQCIKLGFEFEALPFGRFDLCLGLLD